MAILYPNEIVNVYIRGQEFTGNIVSVGVDGLYPYDYSHPHTATVNQPNDTLVLIYPGSYTVNNNTYIISNKTFMWRGMGSTTTSVSLIQYLDYSNLIVAGTYTYNILENFKMYSNKYATARYNNGSYSTNVYLNKMYLQFGGGSFTAGPPFQATNYNGNVYITHSYLNTRRTYIYSGLGQQNLNATYSFLAMQYNKAYSCYDCAVTPYPHTYNTIPGEGFGYNYGDYLIEFNVPPELPPEIIIDDPLYQNVWAVEDYIYHTTSTGVDVYNSDASLLAHHIALPNSATSVWANDEYVYMGTLTSGVYRSTTSGTAYPYIKEPFTTSNHTIYLHGADDFLCLTTYSGVDRYDLSTASGTTISGASRIFTHDLNIHKCFQTTSGTLYYVENNLFFGVDESSLGGKLRDWKYYQHIQFTKTTINDAQVKVIFQPDFQYGNTNCDGDDLRFLDPTGCNLSYGIINWYPNAEVMVKVTTSGTDNFYMLYGNPFASPQSNISDAYTLYDQFEGTSLDTNVWQKNIRNANSYITVANGYVTLRDYDNTGVEIITKQKIPYSTLIEARVRHNGGSSSSQFDGIYGYTTVTTGRVAKGYVKIDPTQGSNETFHYLNVIDSSITGTKPMSTSWKIWKGVWAPGYQSSYYDGETLEKTSTDSVFETENHLFFHINNGSTNPNLNIEWVTMTSWPLNITYTSSQKLFWDLIHPKLHAVYTPSSDWVTADHTYDEFYGTPLYLNDIYVTEGTSAHNNDNTIFLASDRGAYVIEERQSDEENSDRKRYYIS